MSLWGVGEMLQKFWKSTFQVVCMDSTGKLFHSSSQKNSIHSAAGLFPQMWKLIIETKSSRFNIF